MRSSITRGETFLEMIISIAIFALVLGSASYIIQIAENITFESFEHREEFNEKVKECINSDVVTSTDTVVMEVNGDSSSIVVNHYRDEDGALDRVEIKK